MLQYHRRSGFTLVELFVVMIVMAVFVAILMPGVNAARGTTLRGNLRQIQLAMLNRVANKTTLVPKTH
jgi:prepilin-type N-terminal cleavage/methylation domain-containing protein